MGVPQGDTEVLVMTEKRGGERERERGAMKDAVRQAEGQRDRERVEDWEKNHQLWKMKMKRQCGRAL